MKVKCEAVGEELICRIDGQLDMAVAQSFAEEIEKELERPCKKLVFDLEQVDFMDSTGIGKLVRVIEQAKKKNLQCAIVNCREELQEVLDLVGIYQLLEE